VDDVEAAARALASWTKTTGLQVHFVDLRDHYFKYPFEMLTYSKRDWYRWLNPTSNHNRLRLWDYRRIFDSHFGSVEIQILARDTVAFEVARNRIRPEFLSGDVMDDSITLIMILASRPRGVNPQ
jgi:hypothetical protein